jgi:hypothetical protein
MVMSNVLDSVREVHEVCFYHFVAKSTKNITNESEKQKWHTKELASIEHFQNKWGFLPRNNEYNLKSPRNSVRGIKFN